MRVLVTTTGYPGHWLPLLPFARAAAEAGHEVCVAGPAPVADDFEFCAVGHPPAGAVAQLLAEAASRSPEEGHRLMISEGFGRMATAAALPDMLQLAGAWKPDVVLRESQEFAGALAAARHGIPSVRVALGLASTEAETLALAGPELDDEPVFSLLPSGFDDGGGATHRFRDLGHPLRVAERGDPLVYLTFGSVAAARGYFPDLYRDVVASLADLDARVLATVGEGVDVGALGALPANVQVEPWIPQARVLARAAAVVCHGGYGTLLGALAHALPVVVLPLFAGDQWANGRRIARVGAGECLVDARAGMFDRPGASVLEALPAAVERVVNWRRYRRAAWRLADEIAALPPVSGAPAVLSELAMEVTRR